MGRKPIKVYLSDEAHDYLRVLSAELGLSESEIGKIAILNYMQGLGLLRVKYKKVMFARPQPFEIAQKA